MRKALLSAFVERAWFCADMRNEIAIVMAAGMGRRMRPLTDTTAKPLVKVGGVPLVETVLAALERRGVEEIYVVTGYKAEQFAALATGNGKVRLVHNPEYATKNNINSIAVVADKMMNSDCFVCEADLYVANPDVLCRDLRQSGYFGKMVAGRSDDWVFDTDAAGRITRIGKGGFDRFNMVGVSYFRRAGAAKVASAVLDSAKKPENANLFWDEVVDGLVKRGELDLAVHEISPDDIVECDTVEDLERLEANLK